MDIVFLTDQLVRGGAETQLARIATTLRRRGWNVGIITMLPSEEFIEDLKAADIPLFECSTSMSELRFLPFAMAFRMICQLVRWHPAILITFNYHGDILGRICGRIAGVRSIVASLRTAYVKSLFRERLYRWTEGLIRGTVSNSHAGITYMLQRRILTPAKTMVIPNGFVCSSVPPPMTRRQAWAEFSLPPDAFIWLAVGNLRPAKDYATLLDAAERCAATHPEFCLFIAGEGDELGALLEKADQRGLNDKVHFLGSRTDVPALLRCCDAFVLSSAWEGMPNTVMEAMASELPVVSTDAGGVRELLREGVCGYMVPTRNPEALSERMIHLMTLGKQERLKMGLAGRERIAQSFDNERVVNRWEVMTCQVIRSAAKTQSLLGMVNSREPVVMAERVQHLKVPPPGFIISMDFELMWGMRDKWTHQSYGKNILGEREAVPAILRLFKRYEVRATWAAVGMTLFGRRSDLFDHLPDNRPTYRRQVLNPYLMLDEVGEDEKRDPYHFGLDLIRQVLDCQGMELGSHTFSHYYCLAEGQDSSQFKSDLEASIEASSRLSFRPTSFVFPRNQYNHDYLSVCAELGFKVFRGNESSWMYEESKERDQFLPRRLARLVDNYCNLTGDHGCMPRPFLNSGMINCPSSRFLRPFFPPLSKLEGLRVRRIQGAMELAARKGECFHLWWHPHNFGTNLNKNLLILEELLQFHTVLREHYGVKPMTMGEAGQLALSVELSP